MSTCSVDVIHRECVSASANVFLLEIVLVSSALRLAVQSGTSARKEDVEVDKDCDDSEIPLALFNSVLAAVVVLKVVVQMQSQLARA